MPAGCRARAGVKRERVFSRGAPVSGERLERVRFANHRRASRARRIERAARRDDVLAVLRLLLLAGFLVDGRESLQLAEFRLALFSRRASLFFAEYLRAAENGFRGAHLAASRPASGLEKRREFSRRQVDNRLRGAIPGVVQNSRARRANHGDGREAQYLLSRAGGDSILQSRDEG